jgi:hypothetical protein
MRSALLKVQAYWVLSSRLSNLPLGFFGRASANTTLLGDLKLAMFWLQ